MTAGCAEPRLSWNHDYSQPPHNTPDSPHESTGEAPCQSQTADRAPWCQHKREYELVLYQIGTHDWIRLFACTPCMETLTHRLATAGPGGSNGLASVKEVEVPR